MKTKEELMSKTVPELQKEAKELGIDTNGLNKEPLVDEMVKIYQSQEQESSAADQTPESQNTAAPIDPVAKEAADIKDAESEAQTEQPDAAEAKAKATAEPTDPTAVNRDASAKTVIGEDGKPEMRDRFIPPPAALNAVDVENMRTKIADQTSDLEKTAHAEAVGEKLAA